MPSIELIGCGGCGANIVNEMYPHLPKGVKASIIDTSSANIQNEEIEFNIIEGSGSGKVRSTNVGIVNSTLTEIFNKKEVADISLLVFAAGSGSGSVIGPLLSREIQNNLNKSFAIFLVVDNLDGLSAKNSFKTIKTLESLAKSYGLYIPIYVFNNQDGGKQIVNETICTRLSELTEMLAFRNVAEIDKNDRINFFRPDRTVNAAPGIYGFYCFNGNSAESCVRKGEYPLYEVNEVHSQLVIANKRDKQYASSDIDCHVLYSGYFKSDEPVSGSHVAIVGFKLNPNIFSDIEKGIKKFETKSIKGTSQFKIDSNDLIDDSTGLVLQFFYISNKEQGP